MLVRTMSYINTEYLDKCLQTLEMSYTLIKNAEKGSIAYEMYRNALVKGFELTLEQSGKLLRKKLIPYFASKKDVDILNYKDIFREAHKRSLIDEACVNRWFKYRDNRNHTAHDYGVSFAEDTLALMDEFLDDVVALQQVIDNG